MRSLHRYGSDLFVVVVMLHLLREFAMDRYHGVRWFAWFTGVPLIWFLFFSGVSGYWLVWDTLAQYLAVSATEWVDWLGVFAQPMANNFLTPQALGDRFFSLLVYIHIFVPIIMIFVMWIHLLRMARAETNPPRGLALGSLAALLVLSLVYPATSHGPADLTQTPGILHLDWFYLGLFPLYDRWGPGPLWALVVGASTLISVVPFIHRHKPRPAAKVDLANCNGCTRCANDCPFGAVIMQPRSDGRPFDKEPSVNPSICTSCGTCMGACPTTSPFRTKGEVSAGIMLPDYDLVTLRERIDTAVAGLTGPVRILVFGCEWGARVEALAGPEVAAVELRCASHLSPTFVDYAFSRCGVDGIVITGCRDGECFHRLGVRWTEERLAGERDPALRDRVARDRILIAWAALTEQDKLAGWVRLFRDRLAEQRVATPAAQGAEP
jgi:ferredoxin/coenzyme F420-reducing hydrogenase delta subunit